MGLDWSGEKWTGRGANGRSGWEGEIVDWSGADRPEGNGIERQEWLGIVRNVESRRGLEGQEGPGEEWRERRIGEGIG